jgi:hypothetical protein
MPLFVRMNDAFMRTNASLLRTNASLMLMNASFMLTSQVTRRVSLSPFMSTNDAFVLISPSFVSMTETDLFSN